MSEISKYIPPTGLSSRYGTTQRYYSSAYASENQPNILKSSESVTSLQPVNQYVTSSSSVPAPIVQPNNDLLQFIEKQEGYIEQLERESQFCRVSI